MTVYLAADPACPHFTLFRTTDLGELVDALVAQSDTQLIVYETRNGTAVPIGDGDLAQLRDGLTGTHNVHRATPIDVSVTPLRAVRQRNR